MEIRQIVNSVFNSCSYVISWRDQSWLVDCGDVPPVLAAIRGTLSGVLLTHAHFDHIYGLNQLLSLFPGLPIFTNQHGKDGLLSDKLNFSRYHEEPFVLDVPECIHVVDDGAVIKLMDGVLARAVATPGHGPSCITWVVNDAVFTGDSYIPGVKTVTNFPHSDKELAHQSEDHIRQLARGRRVFPGHPSQLTET